MQSEKIEVRWLDALSARRDTPIAKSGGEANAMGGRMATSGSRRAKLDSRAGQQLINYLRVRLRL